MEALLYHFDGRLDMSQSFSDLNMKRIFPVLLLGIESELYFL
jgi:hypothetical protein